MKNKKNSIKNDFKKFLYLANELNKYIKTLDPLVQVMTYNESNLSMLLNNFAFMNILNKNISMNRLIGEKGKV